MLVEIKKSIFVIFCGLSFCFSSCREELDELPQNPDLVKEAIYESMQEWYYWNDRLPASLDVGRYRNNEDLLYDLMYLQLDRWSYLTTRDAFNRAFTGQNAGHGFGFALGDDDRLYISFVYDDSPAGKDGWQRGWEIIEINGKTIEEYRRAGGYNFELGENRPGVSNTFRFRLPDGTTTTRTNTKEEYQANSVLFRDVLETGNKKTGYWVYNSFKATAGLSPNRSLEVEETLEFFETAGIDELILDLRYNGGGSVDVAEQIMNGLVPAAADGALMYTNALNEEKSNLNEEYRFEKSGEIALERLVVITSRGSASASELIINCLKPYLDVILVGQRTYGKPVGSFPLSQFNGVLAQNDVELVPITFAIANAEGNAEYYDGFPVDVPAADDPSVNWGDIREFRLASALTYVQYGTEPTARLKIPEDNWQMIDNFRGLQQEFPVY
ncbi:C-terminal processing protease CtpA/Prc, contains a PDZ domain [Cyclobacterium lianum]|uniref:C-terminal processing protease CtpA/Prc, contains a PDZ domain n=1 Tax=Cyclobacterium lianum TaxID=388280 RepID=A0A1M7PEU3_9BACT|nr:S41 family peptidase [Cyclobacterium lianum]SHN15429.1 C-terminal processing protease CtpA/Prc, contains a PDZ domain [Cyclobacterium lianum]